MGLAAFECYAAVKRQKGDWDYEFASSSSANFRQLPVEFGGALNLFLPRHRETQEANADASGTAQADALSTALMCPSRRSLRALCRSRYLAAPRRGREGAETFCASHHAAS